MTNILIEKQFEANLWANIELITLCATLDDTQLEVEAVGVYGRIQPLIAHIIRAEGNYLRDIGDSNPWAEITDWDSLGFDQLLDMAKQSGNALREAAIKVDPTKRIDYEDDDETAVFTTWTVINQAILHGIEHRTQIKVLLTKLGVEHPDFSVWGYASSIGELTITPKGKIEP